MELVRHNRELAQRMSVLNGTANLQLAKEMMELHQKKCQECQESRLQCTIRPACKDRNFLNALIELGVENQDLPQYCFQQYCNRISRYVLAKKGSRLLDRRIPIKDLLSALKMSSIRQFNAKFKNEWAPYAMVRRHNIMLVAADEYIFHFDFTRGIVVLNPSEVGINRFELFELYVEVLNKYYDLNAEVKAHTLNWWVLRFDIPIKMTERTSKDLRSFLSEAFESFRLDSHNDNTSIEIEIILDNDYSSLPVRNLIMLFNRVFDLVRPRSQ